MYLFCIVCFCMYVVLSQCNYHRWKIDRLKTSISELYKIKITKSIQNLRILRNCLQMWLFLLSFISVWVIETTWDNFCIYSNSNLWEYLPYLAIILLICGIYYWPVLIHSMPQLGCHGSTVYCIWLYHGRCLHAH